MFLHDVTDRKRLEEKLWQAERKHSEALLKQLENRYASLYQNMSVGVIYQSAEGKVTDANPAAERMLGAVPMEISNLFSVGTNLITIHEDGSNYPEEEYPSIVSLKTGKPLRNQVMGVYFPNEKNYHWINISAVPQFNPGEERPYQVFVTFDDITERKRAEDAIQNHSQMLLALHNVALEMGTELQLPALLKSIMTHAQFLVGADRGGGIYLYDSSENTIRLAYGSGINEGRDGITVPINKGVAGRVFNTMRPMVIDDYTHWEGRVTVLVPDPPSTVMGVPLSLNGQVIGALLLFANSHLRKFGEQDVHQAEMFAAQAAIAIRNAQLYQQAQQELFERKLAEVQLNEQLDELRRWHDATLGREGRVLELKREVNQLLAQIGQPPRYPSAGAENQ